MASAWPKKAYASNIPYIGSIFTAKLAVKALKRFRRLTVAVKAKTVQSKAKIAIQSQSFPISMLGSRCGRKPKA